MAEALLGGPIFAGESSLDQLVEIIKVLGTPSKDSINAMNPRYENHKFPVSLYHPGSSGRTFADSGRVHPGLVLQSVRAQSFTKYFRPRTDASLVDLLEKTLVYAPEKRLDAYGTIAHPFFDELRVQGTKLASGEPLPDLFK